MIDITDKKKCCGCSACINICPHNALSMYTDKTGFLYPVAEPHKCTNCHLCEKVCPILCHDAKRTPSYAYAAWNNNGAPVGYITSKPISFKASYKVSLFFLYSSRLDV